MTTPVKALGFGAAFFLILLGSWPHASLATGTGPNPPGTVLYAGRATVLRANVNLLTSNTKVLLADTGELDSSGGTKDATVVTFRNPPPLKVQSRTASAITSGADNVSASSAAVEKLLVDTGSLKVTARVIQANSRAECDPESGTVSVHGSSTIVNLRINDQLIPVSDEPNSTTVIPGVATVIINERFRPDVNSIVVNAVHIIVPGAPGVANADIVISHAESGILICTAL